MELSPVAAQGAVELLPTAVQKGAATVLMPPTAERTRDKKQQAGSAPPAATEGQQDLQREGQEVPRLLCDR
jgi:hypothetical protein